MSGERNVKADLGAVRREARFKLGGYAHFAVPPLVYVDDPTNEAITVLRAAAFAEVKKRTWQRWERAGELPRAVLERFWRRVEEEIVGRKVVAR